MPRPSRDMTMFSVYLPTPDLDQLRQLAEDMSTEGNATTVADLVRGMIDVGLRAMLEADEPEG